MCSAEVFQQEVRLQSLTFMGILRVVKLEDVDGQSREDSSTKAHKIKKEDLPDSIWRVCEELKAISQNIY